MIIIIMIHLLSAADMLHELSDLIFIVTLWGQWCLLPILRKQEENCFSIYTRAKTTGSSLNWEGRNFLYY